jgi:hypothetical protein
MAPPLLMPVRKNAEAAWLGSSLHVLKLRDQHDFLSDCFLCPLTMKESQLVKLTLDGLSELSCQKLHCLRELKLVFNMSYNFDLQAC